MCIKKYIILSKKKYVSIMKKYDKTLKLKWKIRNKCFIFTYPTSSRMFFYNFINFIRTTFEWFRHFVTNYHGGYIRYKMKLSILQSLGSLRVKWVWLLIMFLWVGWWIRY